MRLNEMLGTEFPIIQGGMAKIATGELPLLPPMWGGLGIIGAGGMDEQSLHHHIRVCKGLTEKPFGVNIMLMNPQAGEMTQLVIEEQVSIVTTGVGNPGKYMGAWKEAGIQVFPLVSAVALAPGAVEQSLRAIPYGRMGLAEEVARAVTFFADGQAGYITGQVLCVDGGMCMM